MPNGGQQDASHTAEMVLDLLPTSSQARAPSGHKRKQSAAASSAQRSGEGDQQHDRFTSKMIHPPAMGVFTRDPPKPGPFDPSASASTKQHGLPFETIPTTSAVKLSHAAVSNMAKGVVEAEAHAEADDDPDDDQGTVDEDGGVIRCICGSDEDDGFTIQCDRCLVWQHCACFGMSQASVPDEYLCEQCEPRPVDVAFAQAHQQKRKNDEARKALVDRTLKRQSQSSNPASVAFLFANGSADAPAAAEEPTTPQVPLQPPDAAQPQQQSFNPRSRKPSQALDLSNTQFVIPEIPASAQSGGRSGAKRKAQKGSRSRSGAPETPVATTPSRGTTTPGHRDDRYEDPFDVADKLEAWHVEFTPIGKNLVADPGILGPLAAAMLDWENGSPLRASPGHGGKMVVPVQRHASRRRLQSATTRIDDVPMTVVEEEATGSWEAQKEPRHPSEPSGGLEAEEIGLTAVGNECMPVELQGPSLADLAVKTYVKHISETASAGVFSNVLQLSNRADEPQRVGNASRSFSRPVMHGLFADTPIPAGAFVSEFRGELYSADAYRKDPINQYAALGAVKPHVHLLPPPLNLAIDARRFGSEARFARSSCHPNAVLRPILFRQRGPSGGSRSQDRSRSPTPSTVKTQATMTPIGSAPADSAVPPPLPASDEPELLFGLFAITDISRTHEITVGWEWDDAHIVHFLPELVQNPYMEPRESRTPDGTARSTFDAERHTAHMVALAERGEFPYASTEFSAKMNSVAAALLGCVLCACIGSAAAPGGGGGASSNNARKQDCAVAQMLRVGNGMSLLNVFMPGKTNRRAKLPDFAPLVGVKRGWRQLNLPPTPASSVKDALSPIAYADGGIEPEAALSPHLALVSTHADGSLAHAEPDDDQPTACGQANNAPLGLASMDLEVELGGMDESGRSIPLVQEVAEHDARIEDAEDEEIADSDASSLTDPLSAGSSDDARSSDVEDDPELRRALRFADGKGIDLDSASDSDDESVADSGVFVLPLKKRITRTRIKATLSPTESESEDGPVPKSERADAAARLKAKISRLKRKVKARPSRLGLAAASDEDLEVLRPTKKRKKAGNLADPSSPLSSAPSPGSRNSSLSPPPSVDILGEGESSDGSDASVSRQAASRRSDAARSKSRGIRAGRSRARTQRSVSLDEADLVEAAKARKRKSKARLLRDSIADMGDPESSDDDEAAGSASRDMDSLSTPSRKDAQQLRLLREAAGEEAESVDRRSKKEASSKAKKSRRVVSDTESEESDPGQTPRASRENGHLLVGTAIKPDPGSPASIDASTDTAAQDTKESAQPETESRVPASAQAVSTLDASMTSAGDTKEEPSLPPVPVAKEEPRVKLSLAEYKKRLVERRTSSQATQPQTSSASLSTAAAQPEAAAQALIHAQDGAAVDRLPGIPVVHSARSLAEDDSVALQREAAGPSPKRPSTPPRTSLFASVGAPTAIRSVEIPRSPPPEPMPTSLTPTAVVGDERKVERVDIADQLRPPLSPLGSITDPADQSGHQESLPPPKTPPIKKASLASVQPSAGTDQSSVSQAPQVGAPTLLSRFEKGRGFPAVSSGGDQEDAAARTSRPTGFQPIGARPASHPGPDLSSTPGHWSVATTAVDAPASTGLTGPAPSGSSLRGGFVPLGSGNAASNSLGNASQTSSSPHGIGFGRPTMTAIGGMGSARPSYPSSSSPATGGTIPGRSLSVSSSSSSGGAPRTLPPSPGFNPPRAPRAFLNTAAPVTGTSSLPAPQASSVSISTVGPTATAMTPTRPSIITGANAVPAGTQPISSSTGGAPARHQTASMSPPSPALSLHSISGVNLRDFAGVPTGPASMREREGRSEGYRDARDRDWDRERERDWFERGDRLDRSDRERERDRDRDPRPDREREREREPREPLPHRADSYDEPLAERSDHVGFGLGGRGGRGVGRGGGAGLGAIREGRDLDEGGTSHLFHGSPSGRGFGGARGGGGWGARARARGMGGGGGRGRGGGTGGWGGPPPPPSLPPR